MVARRLRGLALAAGMTLAASAWTRHPLHTTLTELTYDAETRSARASIRVFADDLTAAAGPGDSAAFAYAAAHFTVADRAARPLPLRWCGLRRAGAVARLCLSAPAPDGLAGLSVRNGLLAERFDDQVNIVQASYAGRKTSMLFTRGDRPKRLP